MSLKGKGCGTDGLLRPLAAHGIEVECCECDECPQSVVDVSELSWWVRHVACCCFYCEDCEDCEDCAYVSREYDDGHDFLSDVICDFSERAHFECECCGC